MMETEKAPAVIENYSRELIWENGMPRVVGVPKAKFGRKAETSLRALLREALEFPYDGDNAKYLGLTKGEAMMIQLVEEASNGDPKARQEVLDRVLGKPQQNIKSLTLKGSIESFLDELPPPGPMDYVDVTKAEVMVPRPEGSGAEETVEDL